MSKHMVHMCPDCDEEFHTEMGLVDHLNETHDYGWSYEEFHQICGNMHQEWRLIQSSTQTADKKGS